MKKQTLRIPSREEFHKDYSGDLSGCEFCSEFPQPRGYHTRKVADSFRFRSTARYAFFDKKGGK